MDPQELQALREIKSVWKNKSTSQWVFYCPLCKAKRALPSRPKPGQLLHFVQVGLTAVFFMIVTWRWFTWKGIVSFVLFWAVFEIGYRIRTRAKLVCKSCGFDPYLYLVDVKRAREEVERHWRAEFAKRGIPYPEKNAPKGKEAAKGRPKEESPGAPVSEEIQDEESAEIPS